MGCNFPEHHQGGGGSVLDVLPVLVAALAVGVIAIDVVLWVLHVLVIVAEGIGFVAMGTGGVFAAVKWRQYKNRRELAQQTAQLSQPGQAQQMPRWAGQRAALPPASGDVHLHLPPGMSADEIAQIMQRRRLP